MKSFPHVHTHCIYKIPKTCYFASTLKATSIYQKTEVTRQSKPHPFLCTPIHTAHIKKKEQNFCCLIRPFILMLLPTLLQMLLSHRQTSVSSSYLEVWGGGDDLGMDIASNDAEMVSPVKLQIYGENFSKSDFESWLYDRCARRYLISGSPPPPHSTPTLRFLSW